MLHGCADVAKEGWMILHGVAGVAIAGHRTLHGCADVAKVGWRTLHEGVGGANAGRRALGNV